MITTNLTGNFGNHAFSLLTLKSVAKKLGYEYGVNPTPSHDYHNGMNQMYFMDVDFGKTPENIQHEYHETWIDYQGVNICKFEERIYNINDNTILLGHNGAKGGVYQSEQYFIEYRKEAFEWFKIKENYINEYTQKLSELGYVLDDNLCIINFRGGEYKSVHNLICRKEYWRDSINYMLSINPNMKFLVISDDPNCARNYMPFKIQCIHIDIGFDFFCVNQAKYIILSNSSFGAFAGWMNQKAKLIIAPKYWSQHNTSHWWWGTGDQYYHCFSYMGRDGILIDYNTCKTEAEYNYKERGL